MSSNLIFTVLSETKELIKYTVRGYNYGLQLPDYCFPQYLLTTSEFIIPYSKKDEFNSFIEKYSKKEELKETDNWREQHKEKIDEIFDWKGKNMASTQMVCNHCGASNSTRCLCARDKFHKEIKFNMLEKFMKTGKPY